MAETVSQHPGCLNKTAFASRAEAFRILKRIEKHAKLEHRGSQTIKGRITVQECEYCHMFHHAHMKKTKRTTQRSQRIY